MKAIVLDFETTDATEDAQATEIGIMGVDFYDGILDKSDDKKDVTSRRCKPDRPISYGAMAVTNIFNEDVASCESHIDVCQRLIPKGAAYIIGHNIDFDIRVAANVKMCARLLYIICKQQGITSMDRLYEFSEFARIPTHFPFGKHKGVAIAELAQNHDGRGYLQWVVNSIKDNEYLTTACRKALGL